MEATTTLPAELQAEVEKVAQLCLQLQGLCAGQPVTTALSALFSLYIQLVRTHGQQTQAAGVLLSAAFVMTAEGSAVPPPFQRH